MKHLLLSLTVLGLSAPLLSAEDKPLKERAADAMESIKREVQPAANAAAKAAREGWSATKAYLSQDPREHRDAAARRVEEYAGEIRALKNDSSPVAARPYFQTRLKSLNEQLEFTRAELGKLPAEKTEIYDATRKQFDHTLDHLGRVLDQAQAEVSS